MELELLIKRFQNKDTKAFEKLYSMYCDSVHGIVYNVVRNESMAKEVTQDVFVKIWHKADTYSPQKGRFFTWILNIARNAAIDKTRSAEFKQGKKNQYVENFVDILGSTKGLNSETDAIGIKKFVNQLAAKCVDVIELLYFKGYTQKEASETLELPLGTVKTRIRNCINELRNMLNVAQ